VDHNSPLVSSFGDEWVVAIKGIILVSEAFTEINAGLLSCWHLGIAAQIQSLTWLDP